MFRYKVLVQKWINSNFDGITIQPYSRYTFLRVFQHSKLVLCKLQKNWQMCLQKCNLPRFWLFSTWIGPAQSLVFMNMARNSSTCKTNCFYCLFTGKPRTCLFLKTTEKTKTDNKSGNKIQQTDPSVSNFISKIVVNLVMDYENRRIPVNISNMLQRLWICGFRLPF